MTKYSGIFYLKNSRDAAERNAMFQYTHGLQKHPASGHILHSSLLFCITYFVSYCWLNIYCFYFWHNFSIFHRWIPIFGCILSYIVQHQPSCQSRTTAAVSSINFTSADRWIVYVSPLKGSTVAEKKISWQRGRWGIIISQHCWPLMHLTMQSRARVESTERSLFSCSSLQISTLQEWVNQTCQRTK